MTFSNKTDGILSRKTKLEEEWKSNDAEKRNNDAEKRNNEVEKRNRDAMNFSDEEQFYPFSLKITAKEVPWELASRIFSFRRVRSPRNAHEQLGP